MSDRKSVILLTLALSIVTVKSAVAALSLDATRYVYKGNEQTLSVVVSNDSDREYGAQAWIDNLAEKDVEPTFIVTPSFFTVKGKRTQVVRIMKVSEHMPKDKESIYWLNLQEIPQKQKGSGISLAIRNKVKLIYRPDAIIDGRKGAESNLTVRYLPGQKLLENTTPYIFAIGQVIDINGEAIDFNKDDLDRLSMFMPGDRVDVTGHKVKSVEALDDYGSLVSYTLKPYNIDNESGS